MADRPKSYVTKVGGELVLVDGVAEAVARVAGKMNCRITLDLNADRVSHFTGRIRVLGKTAAEVVIVILNVNDENGSLLADMLMPGMNWQAIRDQGQIPFARGLAVREGIQKSLELLDPEAAVKLRDWQGIAVVVVDHGVAEVFPV